MKNPYSEIIRHMREQGAKFNPPDMQIGIVIAVDPLTIKLGDLQIGKDNLLVADYLLPNYKRKYSESGNLQFSEVGNLGPTNSVTVGDLGSHSHVVTSININTNSTQTGELTLTDGLNINDVLVLVPILDEQTYIVLARLVKP